MSDSSGDAPRGAPPTGHERIRYVADLAVPCDDSGGVLVPGIVEVEGERLVHVGRAPSGVAAREIPLGGLLLPGLVNAHCHSPMTLFRGTGENLPLERWLGEVLWPREARLTDEDVYWGMTLAAAELLRFGITTTAEMYFHEDALADAVLAAGSRVFVGPAVLQLPGADGAAGSWTARLEAICDFHARRDGEAGRIEVGFAPHAPYSVPMEVLVETASLARERDALVQIHVAETEAEARRFEAEHGTSVVAALADAGVLAGRVVAAHAIWISDEDIALLARLGVAVAHCPQSNAKLASGVARLTDLLAAGIRVGVGTDGPASNNDLDLWEEMRLAALLARVRQSDPGALPSAAALDLATRGAAAALGRDDLGVLRPGGPADMVRMELDDPVFVPLLADDHVVEHLVWAAQSRLVTDVWVAGRRVVEAGRCTTVDVDEARHEVQSRARRLADAPT